ncbi:MAG: MarR family transcriptional regulator [Firmicutes bacterium]|nr:MarR family transcriptional regulator [Bacillota bacterium]
MHYGHAVHLLHRCTDQSMSAMLESMDLTAAQGHILGFLAHHNAPCQHDIEKAFHLSHPTVSGLLSRLEKKEFVALRGDESDRRRKRIYLLPKGQQCFERIEELIEANERKIIRGFSEQEARDFSAYLERAIANMCGECRRNKKEEPHS